MNWTVAYRSGGPYTLEDVKALRHNIKLIHPEVQFVVFSDDSDAFAYCDKLFLLKEPWSMGWWSIIECFRFTEKTIFTGLDTIIIKPIDSLFTIIENMTQNQFMMMTPFNPDAKAKGLFASGIMGWNGNFSFLLDEFNPKQTEKLGAMEQDYTSSKLLKRGIEIIKADDYERGIASYKRHYAGTLGNSPKNVSDISILLFHGEPRPSQIKDPFLNYFRGVMK